ncbi:uncharacterized protein LOC112516360 [Cynara cardunculus var. scolymus]|uniref:uncharacterized protein LOC112516360 n=1 Tax=Cynara cardunculus var. scolymus TaxID=59895 RepID=UPI000D630E81|nr:uncharacterized protein LOC112516360 [Cynara cardunculus var. scolymus]
MHVGGCPPLPPSSRRRSNRYRKCSSRQAIIHVQILQLDLMIQVFDMIECLIVKLMSWFGCADDACRKVGCGEGRCVAEDDGGSYHCECKRGWKTMMVAPMPFPSCIVPNCSMDFSCGGKAPPLPPPRPRSPFNATNACSLVWCGAGDCVANGNRHHCRCHNDADNLFNNSAFICMRKCYFKADCNHLGIALTSPPPPPPPTSAGSRRNKITYTMIELFMISIAVFMTTILAVT